MNRTKSLSGELSVYSETGESATCAEQWGKCYPGEANARHESSLACAVGIASALGRQVACVGHRAAGTVEREHQKPPPF